MRKIRTLGLVCAFSFCATGCGDEGSGGGTGGEGAQGSGGAGARGGAGGSGGQPTCAFTPCGGDPTGTWKLITFCGPDYVSSVAEVITFSADGKYSYTSTASGNTYTGTWATSGTTMTITVQQSSTAEYCVNGDVMWWQSGGVTVVRERSGV